jgi:hypothetical protein
MITPTCDRPNTHTLNTVGWGRTQAEPGFGATYDSTSVKAKTINLIASVRTVMRSTFPRASNPISDIGYGNLARPRRSPVVAVEQDHESEPGSKGQTEKLTWNLEPAVPLIIINTVIIFYELILG